MKVVLFLIVVVLLYISDIDADVGIEPVVELRWDFTDCKQTGRFGPSQEQCDEAYRNTNLEDDVTVTYGIQTWVVPITGLYLISAQAPAGLSSGGRSGGRGARLTSNFRMEAGEKLNILIGQTSNYFETGENTRGPGGSGGTYVTRLGDGYILLVAGGGSSSAGNLPDLSQRNHADASFDKKGKNASKTDGLYGTGGQRGLGGYRGFLADKESTSGGGAGYLGNGNYSEFLLGNLNGIEVQGPSIRYLSSEVSDRAAGVGGHFRFTTDLAVENNGGFGGGGSGSYDGGAGGGGGYSGGGGGPWNGWGGGGGSLNNGERPFLATLHSGRGFVTISFTGYSCCGPIIVYVALCAIAGIVFTLLLLYGIYRCRKCIKSRRHVYNVGRKYSDNTMAANTIYHNYTHPAW